MEQNEGYGPNKFYFAKRKEDAQPQLGKEPIRVIKAILHNKKPYDGKLYTKKLRFLRSKGIPREKAIKMLDAELKRDGYDSIEDGFQIAVFNVEDVEIVDQGIDLNNHK